MLLGNRSDDEQTESGALHAHRHGARNTIEPSEDALQLLTGYADPLIGDPDGDTLCIELGDLDQHGDLAPRILDRVVQQVGYGGLELIEIADDGGTLSGR